MVKGLLNTVNRTLSHEDAGKLLLRLAVGGLMLFHGLHKLLDGVDGISGMLVAKGWPGFIAYGVLVGDRESGLFFCWRAGDSAFGRRALLAGRSVGLAIAMRRKAEQLRTT